MKPGSHTDETTDTRTRILREAEVLFAERDFAGTGIDEIAKRAGISKSVIYHHFENKEAILQTLIDGFICDVVEMTRRLNEDRLADVRRTGFPAACELESVIHEMFRFLETRKWMLRIILLESIKNTGDVPLFNFMKKFQGSTEICCGDLSGAIKDRVPDVMVAEFFMNFLPVVGFLVFQDKWCSHFDTSPEVARQKFIDSYVRSMTRAHWPWLIGESVR